LDRAAGTRRVYALDVEGFDSLREYFAQFWARRVRSFKKPVEAPPAKARRRRSERVG